MSKKNKTPDWQKQLIRAIQSLQWGPARPAGNQIKAFQSALELKFIQGVQADRVVLLGYGPRQAGLFHWDIELEEPGCPEEAFEIVPTPEGPMFKTGHPQLIKINGSSTYERLLVEGDVIGVGVTQIRVGFL